MLQKIKLIKLMYQIWSIKPLKPALKFIYDLLRFFKKA